MDIDLLSKMIKELVMDHDRVSLPGLGTFVAETVPATFSDKGYTVNPPYRKLSFRPAKDKESDTLLADFYASANRVSREIAEKALVTFIDGLRDVLQTRKNVVFPGLGRMRATKENNFFFVADEDLDIYPEGFGLVSLSLKTHVETKEEVSAAMDDLETMIEDVDSGLGSRDELLKDGEEEPEAGQVREMEPESEPEAESESGVGHPQEEESDTADEDEVSVQEVSAEQTELESGEGRVREMGTEPESEPEAEPEQASLSEMKSSDASPSGRLRKGLFIAAIILLSLVFLMVVYVVVARLFPDFIDNILYNAEEYNILHRS